MATPYLVIMSTLYQLSPLTMSTSLPGNHSNQSPYLVSPHWVTPFIPPLMAPHSKIHIVLIRQFVQHHLTGSTLVIW